MEETLLEFGPAILAVAVAVFLRMRTSRREACEEIAALQKKVATLEQRTRQLEQEQGRNGDGASDVPFPQRVLEYPQMKPDTGPQTSPVDHPELTEHSWLFIRNQEELYEAFYRLNAMKAQLPFDSVVDEKYIAEFNSIVDRLERATGSDLSRWLGPERFRDRIFFRLQILSLRAFCSYQMLHPQLPSGFVQAPPGAARLIH